MGKIDIENGNKQAKDFKEQYGEYPIMPIRLRYTWKSTKSEGDLQPTRFGTYMIFGFPGMVGTADEEVSDVLFLYDGEGRLFPGVTEEQCVLKPSARQKK